MSGGPASSAFAGEGERDYASAGMRLKLRLAADVAAPNYYTDFLAEHLPEIPGGSALDLGTGSGVLALCLVKYRGARLALGLDVSAAAVACARGNATLNGAAGAVDFFQGDFRAWTGSEKFDLIVANPPQMPTPPGPAQGEAARRAAIDAGRDGRELLDAIAAWAPSRLAAGGRLLLAQAAFTDWDKTLLQLRREGLSAAVAATKEVIAGPLTAGRADYIEASGFRFRRGADGLRFDLAVLSGVKI